MDSHVNHSSSITSKTATVKNNKGHWLVVIVPWACEAFSKHRAEELIPFRALHWCWTLFMIKLWNHGLLKACTMKNCSSILERSKKNKGSDTVTNGRQIDSTKQYNNFSEAYNCYKGIANYYEAYNQFLCSRTSQQSIFRLQRPQQKIGKNVTASKKLTVTVDNCLAPHSRRYNGVLIVMLTSVDDEDAVIVIG
ncbi:hypothetical protein KIW84_075524 [Lathyrus oleraceus]|uniref:Polycomb protein VEFS-Box domain-containing protein n=1 Tax=Pisum sativum TaxID=3888 RepID=A0A9D4VV91_PEA|nr:hypothetical protein KIW84_075524 [Pisum sativum]